MTDRHCHVLFEIDDGAENKKESIAMLRAAQKAGFTTLIATPHKKDAGLDVRTVALKRIEDLQVSAAQLGLTLALGFEVHWNALSRMEDEEILLHCLGATKEILIEFDFSSDLPWNMEKGLYALQRLGLQVVIAHPERYAVVAKDFGVAADWVEMGCYLQLDANVLRASRFDNSRRCAKTLLDNGLYRYAASDAHCERHYEEFAKAHKWLKENYSDWNTLF